MKTHAQDTNSDHALRIVITGGGTGGHVYPGIATAKELQRRLSSVTIRFIGVSTGLEAKIVPHEGFELDTIRMQGFIGKGMGHKLKTLCLFPLAVYRSWRLLKAFRPHVVFGTGGYVSVPVIYAAYLSHIPTIILEPNRQPGVANRLLSKSVNTIAICFEDTATWFPANKVIMTGNPIREEFAMIGQTPPPDKGATLNVLIIGGSLGAKRINDAMIEAMDELTEAHRDRLALTHQTGPDDYMSVKTGYERRHIQADVLAYIDDIPKMYAKSHLLICRAGAGTIAELKASRRPAIVIPYPHADGHQEGNARALEATGQARVIVERDLSGKTLANALSSLLDHPDTLTRVWDNPLPFDTETAASKIAEICLQLAHHAG